jgi:protein gp37
MGDLFHKNISNGQIGQVWNKAFNNPKHTWMFLTKRPEKLQWWSSATARVNHWPEEDLWPSWMWLGVTAENQKRAMERIPVLLEVPASVRWVSFEPLLGPIINLIPNPIGVSRRFGDLKWVVVGAETGPRKRPMDLDWARSIRDQCIAAGVPFFFKKDSQGNRELDGQLWEQYP